MGRAVDQMAREVARLLPASSYVNLGIGLPTSVAPWAVAKGVTLHTENGIIGMGGPAPVGAADSDVINAAKEPVTLELGAAIVDHGDSFAIIRSGRLDVAVLGAYQISVTGDLANWRLPGSAIGSVGGAMDLAACANCLIVMMKHVDPQGRPKIVAKCTYPVTARRCVDFVVTDLATLRIDDDGMSVVAVGEGVTQDDVQRQTEAALTWEVSDAI